MGSQTVLSWKRFVRAEQNMGLVDQPIGLLGAVYYITFALLLDSPLSFLFSANHNHKHSPANLVDAGGPTFTNPPNSMTWWQLKRFRQILLLKVAMKRNYGYRILRSRVTSLPIAETDSWDSGQTSAPIRCRYRSSPECELFAHCRCRRRPQTSELLNDCASSGYPYDPLARPLLTNFEVPLCENSLIHEIEVGLSVTLNCV